jgi:elongation factor P
MSMLEYNEIVERKYIVLDGQPYEVITSHVFRKQQRKPVNATKLKNLITRKVTEYSFHVSEKVEEAEIESREIKYLYANKNDYWFCLPTEPSNRFSFTFDQIGSRVKLINVW